MWTRTQINDYLENNISTTDVLSHQFFHIFENNVKMSNEQIVQCYKLAYIFFRVALHLLKFSDKILNNARLLKMQYFILMVYKTVWRTNRSDYRLLGLPFLCARHHHVRLQHTFDLL